MALIAFALSLCYHHLVDASQLLRQARRKAGLSQRQLAARSGVPQPTIARIEAGRSDARFAMVHRLLEACDMRLVSEHVAGRGIDRTAMREMLALRPTERLALAVEEARNLAAFEQRVRSRDRPRGDPAR
jgi:predicted transcriptional regulator